MMGRMTSAGIVSVLLIALSVALPARADIALQLGKVTADKSGVIVENLPTALLAKFAAEPPTEAEWRQAFQVRIDGADLPIMGDYGNTKNAVTFTPRFDFDPSVRYEAVFDLSCFVAASCRGSNVAELTFAVPKEAATSIPEVTAIYPSASSLPENLLRLYIHFSEPMQRGSVREAFALYRGDGSRVESPFLNLKTELWDTRQRRLTLLLDPGRIKRDVGPNRDVGPPFRSGQSYRLEIAQTLTSADGDPLRDKAVKLFTVTAPERQAMSPETWSLSPVRPGSKDPLVVRSSRVLDRGGLEHAFRVEASNGDHVPVNLVVGTDETILEFLPSQPWTKRAYALVVSADLEDVAGNRVGIPFDVDGKNQTGATDARKREADAARLPIPFAVPDR